MKLVASSSIAILLLALCGFAAPADLRLIEAVKTSQSGTVQALLQQHVNANTAEPDGTTALHWAAQKNNVEAAGLLLRAGANARTANRYGVTPLSLAAANGNAMLIELLLKAGADPNTR